jgi:large subunit ribosomal protein L21
VYAIIDAGGKQFKVQKDDVIEVYRLGDDEGAPLVLDKVLLVCDDKGVKVGKPYVEGVKVEGKVLKHFKGVKIHGFTYKPKKDVRRRYGHRQYLTSVKIENISVG